MIITKEDVSRILKTGSKEEIQFAMKVYFKNKLQKIREQNTQNNSVETSGVVEENEDISAAKKIFGIEN